MTGEITLRGRVLPVGGVKEKVLAAHRVGLSTIILPTKNDNDLVDVPKKARKEMNIRLVDHMDEVLEIALAPAAKKKKRSQAKKEKSDNEQLKPGKGDQ
jgi:ATP-dependent Lon protease